MKKILLITIFFLFLFFLKTNASFASTYYVSNAGLDTNNGTSESTPWKTLAKVNSATFIPGDQILFKKGDTFYGSLTIGQSGTSGSPITYSTYGTGANPIITGLTAVTSWTNLGSNVWESTSAVSTLSTLDMVVINDTNTGMGRTPNTGYYYFQSHSDNYHITSNNLTGTPNWTGAELALTYNYYTSGRLPITNQSGSTLTFTQPEPFSIYANGMKFIIQNDARTLDIQNEWYYNPSTKKIRIYSTSEPTNVRVATTNVLVTVGNNMNYITFDDISFVGANSKIFNFGANNHNTIQNCSLLFAGSDAIYGTYTASSYLTVDHTTITDSNNGAIGLASTPSGTGSYWTNSTFTNNTIINSGMIYGATSKLISGTNGAQIAYGISVRGDGHLFENNVIINTGYVGIRFHGNNVMVRNNYIYKYCQNHHDGGGIYTWTGSVNTTVANQQVLNNIVINELVNTDTSDGQSGKYDSGVYLDYFSNHVTVSGNTMANTSTGLFLLQNHDIIATNNTMYNNSLGVRMYSYDNYTMTNMSLSGNKILAKDTTQVTLKIDPIVAYEAELTSNNNYWARPIADNTSIMTINRTTGSPVTSYITLSQWKTHSNQDSLSSTSPVAVSSTSDIFFDYNASTSNKTVSLPWASVAMNGTKQSAGNITILPYSSVIYLKDPNPATPPPSDTTPPTISSFSIPTTSTTLSISPITLSATDTIGVTGYLLSESSTTPSPSSGSWSSTPQTTYTFTTQGSKTLYAFAKDAAGNVSNSATDSVVITLPPITYTLTYTANANGTISGTTPQTVNSGSSGTVITAIPSAGYHFVSWSDSSTANPRTDTNVTANKSVSASFAINTYNLVSSSGTNGTISPLGTTTKNYATSQIYTITPSSGYHIANVLVDGVSQGTINTYTFTNISATHTISITFDQDTITTYTLTYTANANGTLSGTATQVVNANASGTAVTAVPNTGYHFVSWSDASTTNPRTDTNVTANKTISATFAIDTVVAPPSSSTSSSSSSSSITPSTSSSSTSSSSGSTSSTSSSSSGSSSSSSTPSLTDIQLKAKSKDIKPDGSLNIFDFNIMMANWNKTYTTNSLSKGDMTGDGIINIFDINQLMIYWDVKYTI